MIRRSKQRKLDSDLIEYNKHSNNVFKSQMKFCIFVLVQILFPQLLAYSSIDIASIILVISSNTVLMLLNLIEDLDLTNKENYSLIKEKTSLLLRTQCLCSFPTIISMILFSISDHEYFSKILYYKNVRIAIISLFINLLIFTFVRLSIKYSNNLMKSQIEKFINNKNKKKVPLNNHYDPQFMTEKEKEIMNDITNSINDDTYNFSDLKDIYIKLSEDNESMSEYEEIQNKIEARQLILKNILEKNCCALNIQKNRQSLHKKHLNKLRKPSSNKHRSKY